MFHTGAARHGRRGLAVASGMGFRGLCYPPAVNQPVHAELQRRLDRALRQQAALLALATVDDHAFDERLRRILEVDAGAIGTARVSFWSFVEQPPAILCEVLYLADGGRFEHGLVLAEADYPGYFEALRAGKIIAAADAHVDPRTREFSAGYLTPSGIGAMLDVPVYVRGRLVGVVCHEHVGGSRTWDEDEQLFAMSIGQLVALAIEARRRERAEAAVRASEARFRSMVEASPVPMLVSTFPGGTVLYGNRAVSEASGVPYQEIVGNRTPDWYVDTDDRAALMAELAERGRVSNREVLFRRADGSTYWALLSVVQIEYGDQPATISAFHDLTERKQLEEKLRVMALYDPLTGLANRSLFFDVLRHEVARAGRDPDYRFGVMYLDLDGFKEVNDRWGHDVGDVLLIAVAERLRRCLRAVDTAARMGGDEFTVLLAGLKDPDEATAVAARVAAALREPVAHGDLELRPAASIGIAIGDATRTDPGEILRSADEAMYRAKFARDHIGIAIAE